MYLLHTTLKQHFLPRPDYRQSVFIGARGIKLILAFLYQFVIYYCNESVHIPKAGHQYILL